MIGPRRAWVAFFVSLVGVALVLGVDPRALFDASGLQNALEIVRAFGRPETGGGSLTRITTMVGFVGVGGIGDALHTAISLFHFSDLATLLGMLIGIVALLDVVGGRVRARLPRVAPTFACPDPWARPGDRAHGSRATQQRQRSRLPNLEWRCRACHSGYDLARA